MTINHSDCRVVFYEKFKKMLDFWNSKVYNKITVKIDKLYEQPARAERRMKMEDMGMTDKQFNAFLRQLIKNLKKANEEKEESKTKEIENIIEDLQKSIED